jgi:putative transcriptional regulator
MTTRKTLAELRAEKPKFAPEQRAELLARSDAEIESAALDDPDNLPLSDDDLARMASARAVRQTREATGMSQSRFAEQYRINPARLRDWEQGRFEPDSAALAYLQVIREARNAVNRVLGVEDVVRAAKPRASKSAAAQDVSKKVRMKLKQKRDGG